MSDIQKPKIQPGIYRNRKNQKLYFFSGKTRKNSETLEPMVEYDALYENGEGWTRPISIFLEEKEPGNPKSTRFELLVRTPKFFGKLFSSKVIAILRYLKCAE